MQLRWSDLFELIRETVFAPRVAAGRLLALNLPMQARWIGLGIVIALSAVLATLSQLLMWAATDGQLGGSPAGPVWMALLQGALLVYGAWAMAFFGQRFGGRGRFADALVLLVWMEFVLIVGQSVQMVLMFLFPLVAAVLTFVLILLMIWLLIRFTAALHGFANMVLVSLAVIGVFVGSALVFGLALISLGIMPPPGP